MIRRLLGFTDDADIAEPGGDLYPPFLRRDEDRRDELCAGLHHLAGDNLRQALQKITNITLKNGVIAAEEVLLPRYGGGTTYALNWSDTPDEVTTYPMRGKPIYDVDADRRNKIRVIGGWTYSDIIDDSFSGTGQTVSRRRTGR